MLKTIKHWWKKSKTQVNEEIHYDHGLKDSIYLDVLSLNKNNLNEVPARLFL